MAAYFSILAQIIPWTEEPGGLQFMGSQRGAHDGAQAHMCMHTHTHTCFFAHNRSSFTCNSPKPETTHIGARCCVTQHPSFQSLQTAHIYCLSFCGSGIWEQLHQVVLVPGHP